MSRITLLTGLATDYNKHYKVAFGKYVQVYNKGSNLLSPGKSEATEM